MMGTDLYDSIVHSCRRVVPFVTFREAGLSVVPLCDWVIMLSVQWIAQSLFCDIWLKSIWSWSSESSYISSSSFGTCCSI